VTVLIKWLLQTRGSHVIQRGALQRWKTAKIKLMILIHVFDRILYALLRFPSKLNNDTLFGLPLEKAPQTRSEHRDGHQ
jgi:hypothetical protein